MDLLIFTTLSSLVSIMSRMGFKHGTGKGYLWFKRGLFPYRIHCYAFTLRDNIVAMEIHADFIVHFMFLGVDFQRIPSQFFKVELLPVLKSNGIRWKILGGFNWFSRRNPSIFREFKPCPERWKHNQYYDN